MYVYIQTESALWTAGFYDPSGQFQPESDHTSTEAAAKRVAWLNGGTPAGIVSADTESDKYFERKYGKDTY